MCAVRKDERTGEPNRGGRARALRLALREIVTEQPGATLEAVTQILAERCEVKVCSLTVRRALQEAGITRIKPIRRAPVDGQAAKGPERYGYTRAHRREHTGRDYSCGLTDAEWELVADLFEHQADGQSFSR